jgi:alkylated DNA repair protein (DNA oxidative demethylase)
MNLEFHPGYFDRAKQELLAEEIRAIVRQAPLFTPSMPKSGKPMSVRMTNCGPLGWVSDKNGYRYQDIHPVTGQKWPRMPQAILTLWNDLSRYPEEPEACLINLYDASAKMGLHQDKDEQDFDAPVISVSLGDTCIFRVGGIKRTDPTKSFRLSSGDVIVLGGTERLVFHGVDRIIPGSSTVLRFDGRINLTIRRVTKPTNRKAQPTAFVTA